MLCNHIIFSTQGQLPAGDPRNALISYSSPEIRLSLKALETLEVQPLEHGRTSTKTRYAVFPPRFTIVPVASHRESVGTQLFEQQFQPKNTTLAGPVNPGT